MSAPRAQDSRAHRSCADSFLTAPEIALRARGVVRNCPNRVKDPMTKPTLGECHIDAGGEWRPISIDQAMKQVRPRIRCPFCFGPVRANKQAIDGVPRAHFEHRRAHKGYQYSHKFKGTVLPESLGSLPRNRRCLLQAASRRKNRRMAASGA